MAKRKILFIVLLVIFILFFNDILGWALAELGGGRRIYAESGKVFIYENTGGATAYFMKSVLKTNAFTLGHFIISTDAQISYFTYQHELAHVKQYELLGPLFLPAYFIAHSIAFTQSKFREGISVHDTNIFERWADSVAGP